MTTRQDIVAYARTLVGTRFQHQGRTPGRALDCVGVVSVIAKHFGLTEHDYTGYSNRPDGFSLTREFDSCLHRITHAQVQPGDVLTFWCEAPGLVQHAAVCTDRGLVHATIAYRKVVEQSIDQYWQERVAVAYKFPNIDSSPHPGRFPWRTVDPEVLRRFQQQQAAMGIPCCGG